MTLLDPTLPLSRGGGRFPRPLARALPLILAVAALDPVSALARDFRVGMMPNGTAFGCATCHNSASGGGSRNPFGQAVNARVSPGSRAAFWNAALAALDSDGDGFTNGEELGDPDGDGVAIVGWKATNPGSAASKPVNQPPSVTVAGPADGSILSAPAVAALTATAADADGSVSLVEFFSNGRLLGSVRQAPFSLMVDWSLGAHTVTARATDNQGAAATSTAFSMTVNAPEATTVSAAVSGGNVQVNWAGGGGPFAVQGKAAIEDPWCTLSDVTTNRSATLPARGVSGLMRVADLAVGGAIPLTVVLSGAFEKPNAVTTDGAGSGTLKIQGSTLTFDIRYSGLGGPATAAHIHGPAGVDGTAGVMINLAPFNGGAFGTAGTFSGSIILAPEQKAAILSGKTYVNVHTAANGPGEIRGQVVPVLHQTTMSGANERPSPVATAARGGGYFLLAGDQLTFSVTYSGLSVAASAAHLHGPADADGNAGVLVDLAPFNGGAFGTSGSFAGTVTLTPAQLSALQGGRVYLNVHTPNFPAGEIRGQVMANPTSIPLSATLGGAFERPNPVTTTGTGAGIFALEGDTLHFHLRYSGLGGPATAAHIHGSADVNGTAGVLINLAPFNGGGFGASGTFSGAVVLTPEQKTALTSGLTYVNIHTAANAPGEIRGQIAPVLLSTSLSGANERPNPVTTAGTGSGHFLLIQDRLQVNATYGGLSGPATAAHLHGPADANANAGVLVDLAPLHGGAFGAAGGFAGMVTLNPATVSAVVGGLTYMNVHTAANGPGEVRGQVLRPVAP